MKKFFFIVVTACLLVTTGCGKSASEVNKEDITTKTERPVTEGNVMVESGEWWSKDITTFSTAEEALANCNLIKVADNREITITVYAPEVELISAKKIPEGEQLSSDWCEASDKCITNCFTIISNGCYLFEYKDAKESHYVFIRFL